MGRIIGDDKWRSCRFRRARRQRPKRHQAVSGYWHTQQTLGRWCRIRSYLDSAANHGHTALDAISNALAGRPWLPGHATRPPGRGLSWAEFSSWARRKIPDLQVHCSRSVKLRTKADP
jgi:hypothetical protein